MRPLMRRDRRRWIALRDSNESWLSPWEATLPQNAREPKITTFSNLLRSLNNQARSGTMLPFAIEVEKRLIGQVTLSSLTFGAIRSAQIGYWIDQEMAGRGWTTRAVSLLSDHAFRDLQLHRLEINMRPENLASRRVAEKCGYAFEGHRASYIHIDGAWRDHLSFVRINSRD